MWCVEPRPIYFGDNPATPPIIHRESLANVTDRSRLSIVQRVYDGVPSCNSAVNDEDDDEDNENDDRPEASYTHRMIIILTNARRYESSQPAIQFAR